jgi:hypothetical protein
LGNPSGWRSTGKADYLRADRDRRCNGECALVGNHDQFQPKTYFNVKRWVYMIFIVLDGGFGTFDGAIRGAVIFFLFKAWFGATGVWYLVGLGATDRLNSLAKIRCYRM